MATLILTAVGTAVGGPIGGAIGAIIGQQADRAIFGPKARHGPRLGELAVQTSSYGTAIPKIFGTMRVAGTVIWSTDLIESRSTSGGGKGQPKTVNYSYAASFAVALSARPVRNVRRIWADGKLLRGAAGDFKSATGYRLHGGDEDQTADPLIASVEGMSETPAFRGIAYALFENFQLEDYGNRIPSLTFEVEADEGDVTIGAIAEALSDDAITAGITPSLAGYAAGGDSVRGALEALAEFAPLSLFDDGEALNITAEAPTPIVIGAEEESGRREVVRRGIGSIPGEVSIAYHDLGRDYQTGLQRAVRGPSSASSSADRRALPAVLSSAGAKALAEHRLAALWAGRTGARLRLGWRRCGLRPGNHVRLGGEPGVWRIERWTLERMAVRLDLVRVIDAPVPDPGTASPGRPVSQPDLAHGPTILRLHDLPLGEAAGGKPLLFAAAAGTEPGWRRAALTLSYDGGSSWSAAGATAAPAVIGTATGALAPRGAALFDEISTLDVELANETMWLEGRSDDALAGGANLALVGSELVQFAAVEPLGARRFRLSRLLRGRRGTEWAAGQHQAGDGFVLLDPDSLKVIESPPGTVGGEAMLLASGVGDLTGAVSATVGIAGASLQPPSPVHLGASREPGGDILINWVRRSRQGWQWLSGSDTPLGEEMETYRLEISGAGFQRVVNVGHPEHRYTIADQAGDGATGEIHVSVRQVGTFAASRAAELTIH